MLRAPIVLLRNVLVFLKFLWSAFWHRVRYFFHRKKKLYVSVDVEPDHEFGPPAGLAAYFRDSLSLLELREWMERIAETDAVDGLAIQTNGLQMGTARAGALAGWFDDVRESGKHVVAHARTPTTGEYLVATAADDILLTPPGTLLTFGPRFDQVFAAEALDRLGIRPQHTHIGDFKTAYHRFLHAQMPVPQEAMMQSLHGSFVDLITGRIAERRGFDPEEADTAFENAPIRSGPAVQHGLVDHVVYRNRVETWLRYRSRMVPAAHPPFQSVEDWESLQEGEVPEGEPPMEEPDGAPPDDVSVVSLENAPSLVPPEFDWTPIFGTTPRIAVMDLSGMIVPAEVELPVGGASVVDPDEVNPKLEEIGQSGMFDAAILHLNSPGGSGLATEVVWNQIQRLRTHLPVVAYCTDVAASGGFYLAVGTDHIVSHSVSLMGSIGVVSGKFSAPDVPEKLGLNLESIYEHAADTFTSLVHPLDEEMLDRVSEGARSFYRRFLNRVGQNRGLSRRRLHRYARGRVYTGAEAERRDLVDETGGLDAALSAAGRMADVDPDEADITFVPHEKQGLRQMMGLQMASAPDIPASLARTWLAMKILDREHLLAMMPRTVDWSR